MSQELKNGEANDIDFDEIDYQPTIEDDSKLKQFSQIAGWIDYSKVPLNQIYLINNKDILTKKRPSWIPEFDIKYLESLRWLPPFIQDNDGNYKIFSKIGDENRFYKVSPDLLVITIDYYLKYKKAELRKNYEENKFIPCKEIVINALKNTFENTEQWENYTKATVGGAINSHTLLLEKKLAENLNTEFNKKFEENPDIKYFIPKTSIEKFVKKHLLPNNYSMSHKTALEFNDFFIYSKNDNIKDPFNKKFKTAFENDFGKNENVFLPKKQKGYTISMSNVRYKEEKWLIENILSQKYTNDTKHYCFSNYKKEIDFVRQKLLDLNYQKLDYIGRFTKGQETSYGDTNLNDSLKDEFGVLVKRQDGSDFSSKQIENTKQLLTNLYAHYGDLSKEFTESGYKISYAADVHQHASKSIGLYFPFYKAIGVSVFGNDIESASETLAHEIAHYLDGKSGSEKNRWFASDEDGSLENKIANTFRKHLNNRELSDYWVRTCECFARALEQYYSVERNFEDELKQKSNKLANHFFGEEQYCSFEDYNKYIKPLVQEYMIEHAKRFGFEEPKFEKPEYEKFITNLNQKSADFTKDIYKEKQIPFTPDFINVLNDQFVGKNLYRYERSSTAEKESDSIFVSYKEDSQNYIVPHKIKGFIVKDEKLFVQFEKPLTIDSINNKPGISDVTEVSAEQIFNADDNFFLENGSLFGIDVENAREYLKAKENIEITKLNNEEKQIEVSQKNKTFEDVKSDNDKEQSVQIQSSLFDNNNATKLDVENPTNDELLKNNSLKIWIDEANTLQIKFTQKPSDEIREELKSNKFRWGPKTFTWYTKDLSKKDFAKQFAEKMQGIVLFDRNENEKNMEEQKVKINSALVANWKFADGEPRVIFLTREEIDGKKYEKYSVGLDKNYSDGYGTYDNSDNSLDVLGTIEVENGKIKRDSSLFYALANQGDENWVKEADEKQILETFKSKYVNKEFDFNKLSENGKWVFNNASNGMLAKYITTDEIDVINKFREYAAMKITGNFSDKTYFEQMWKLGQEFCRENGMEMPEIPSEIRKEMGEGEEYSARYVTKPFAELSENGKKVIAYSDSNLYSKYINSNETDVINIFREYAAGKITGSSFDKTYFEQMWKLGQEFCQENGMEIPTIPATNKISLKSRLSSQENQHLTESEISELGMIINEHLSESSLPYENAGYENIKNALRNFDSKLLSSQSPETMEILLKDSFECLKDEGHIFDETIKTVKNLLSENIDIELETAMEKSMEENEKIPLGEAIEQTLFEMGAVPEEQRKKSYEERLRDGELTDIEKEERRSSAKNKLSNLMENERIYVKEHTPPNYSYHPNAYFNSESVFEDFSKIVNSEIEKNNEDVISKILNFVNSENKEYEYTMFGEVFAKQLLHDIDRKNYFEYLSELAETNETDKNPTISKFLEIIKSDEYGESSYQHPEMSLDFIKDTVELIKSGKAGLKNSDNESIESLINSFEVLAADGSNYNDYAGNPDFKGKDSRSFGSKEQYYHWALNRFHYEIAPFIKDYEVEMTAKSLREAYTELGENNKTKYEPFVFDIWSESSIFNQLSHSNCSLKEFNDIISREDKRKYELKNKFYEKYGRDADYYELLDSGKLGEEFKDYAPGYDKSGFVICIPKENPDDDIIYTPDRYDIGDGEGSVFDFIRKTCFDPNIINEMDRIENELYYPEHFVNYLQKDEIRKIVEEARELYHVQLEDNLKKGETLKNSTYVRLWEDIGYKKNVDSKVQTILNDSKESFEQFVRNVVDKIGKGFIHPLSDNVPDEIDNPKMTGLMTTDVAQKFIAKEIRKTYIDEMYHNAFQWDDVKRSINGTVDFVHIEELVKENISQYINLAEQVQIEKISKMQQTEEYKQQQAEKANRLAEKRFEDASNHIHDFVVAELDKKKDKILSEEKISQMDLGELHKKLFARTNDEEYDGMAEAIVEHLNTHRTGIISGETTLEWLAEETVKDYINSVNKKNLNKEWENRQQLKDVDSKEKVAKTYLQKFEENEAIFDKIIANDLYDLKPNGNHNDSAQIKDHLKDILSYNDSLAVTESYENFFDSNIIRAMDNLINDKPIDENIVLTDVHFDGVDNAWFKFSVAFDTNATKTLVDSLTRYEINKLRPHIDEVYKKGDIAKLHIQINKDSNGKTDWSFTTGSPIAFEKNGSYDFRVHYSNQENIEIPNAINKIIEKTYYQSLEYLKNSAEKNLGKDLSSESYPHDVMIEKGYLKELHKKLFEKPEVEKSQFDKELSDFIDGKLKADHIFNFGKPNEILKRCGFPEDQRIEMSASRLQVKSNLEWHKFDLKDVYGLDKALQNPVAVIEYGDRKKSQNVIVELEKDGKKFLAGIHFNQKTRGFEVSDVRTLFPKDNIEILNWIDQGKMIYGNNEKIQALIEQQRINVAEVNNQVVQSPLHEHCLESVTNLMKKFGDVNQIFTDDFDLYKENKERFQIFKKFNDYYTSMGTLDGHQMAQIQAEEFYKALKENNEKVIARYTSDENLYEISHLAREITKENSNYKEFFTKPSIKIDDEVSINEIEKSVKEKFDNEIQNNRDTVLAISKLTKSEKVYQLQKENANLIKKTYTNFLKKFYSDVQIKTQSVGSFNEKNYEKYIIDKAEKLINDFFINAENFEKNSVLTDELSLFNFSTVSDFVKEIREDWKVERDKKIKSLGDKVELPESVWNDTFEGITKNDDFKFLSIYSKYKSEKLPNIGINEANQILKETFKTNNAKELIFDINKKIFFIKTENGISDRQVSLDFIYESFNFQNKIQESEKNFENVLLALNANLTSHPERYDDTSKIRMILTIVKDSQELNFSNFNKKYFTFFKSDENLKESVKTIKSDISVIYALGSQDKGFDLDVEKLDFNLQNSLFQLKDENLFNYTSKSNTELLTKLASVVNTNKIKTPYTNMYMICSGVYNSKKFGNKIFISTKVLDILFDDKKLKNDLAFIIKNDWCIVNKEQNPSLYDSIKLRLMTKGVFSFEKDDNKNEIYKNLQRELALLDRREWADFYKETYNLLNKHNEKKRNLTVKSVKQSELRER